MCTPIPVTLYGTTQITTSRTITQSYLSLYDGDPIISLTTVQTQDCDVFGCRQTSRAVPVTVTPTLTTTMYTTTVDRIVLTSVIPQQTIFQSCSGGASRSASMTFTTKLEDVDTFRSATPVPTSSSSALSGNKGQLSEATFSLSSTSGTPRTATYATDIYTTSPSSTTATSSRQLTSITALSPTATTSTSTVSTSSSSSSSGTVGAVGTNAAVSSPSSTAKDNNAGAVAGGIAGGLIALVLLCAIITYLRRSRAGGDNRSLTTNEDYWERRFQAIEAGVDEKDDGKSEVSGKKLRLTLDLGSKALSMKTTSRMSVISSYFFPSAGREGPVSKAPADFSRPMGKRHSTKSGTSDRSMSIGDRSEVDPMPCVVVVDSSDVDGRKGIEWMRTDDDTSGVEEDGESAMALHRLGRMVHQQPGMGQSPPRSLTPPKLPPASTFAEDTSPFVDPQKASPTTYPAPPARSFSTKRQSRGLPKPDLTLCRAAVTPSMWIDEDAYDEFTKGASRFSPESEGAYSGVDFASSRSSLSEGESSTPPERSAVTPRLPVWPAGHELGAQAARGPSSGGKEGSVH